MRRWTLATLLTERGLLASLLGIAAALVVGLLVDAVFRGEAERIVVYPQRSGADVWIMQEGVENLHMASSLVRHDLVGRVAAEKGVAEAGAILYRNAFVDVGSEPWFTYVVARDRASTLGSVWDVGAGRADPRPGEAVVSEVLARRAGLGIGDRVALQGRSLEIVGLSRGTWSMANTITFVAWEDLASMMSAPESASYVLVKAAPGVTPTDLAERLRREHPALSVLTTSEMVRNDFEMASQMGTQLIGIMRIVGAAAAALVVAFATFAATSRRVRELAVLRALGVRDRTLYGAALIQALLLAAGGLVVAVVLVAVGAPVVQAVAPEINLSLGVTGVAWLAAGAGLSAAVAALVPIRRMAAIDPALAFREGGAS